MIVDAEELARDARKKLETEMAERGYLLGNDLTDIWLKVVAEMIAQAVNELVNDH